MNYEKWAKVTDNKNVCNCPYDLIEYLIRIGDNNEAINVKTGRCINCGGIRLNKLNIVLKTRDNTKLKGGKIKREKTKNRIDTFLKG